MNNLDAFIQQIKSQPDIIEFQDVISLIDAAYHYTPTPFRNGPAGQSIDSNAGENEGSCKIFAFAQLHQLDKFQTLNCFGKYYRDEVLAHPEGTGHANIRSFMQHGWEHIAFDAKALAFKG
ncbi:MAG: HopJ type III effector protein [Gammaproteobacteria bacterium]|nr:HopJ type III effector protein [Gammaproteobacteria bacterium]